MNIEKSPANLATNINSATDFCWQNRGRVLQWAASRQKLFRYVAFCIISGKIAISFENGNVKAVIFYWCDFQERIEAKYEHRHPQFEWKSTHNGDSVFVGDVIGDRLHVSKLWQSAVEKWPHLLVTPIFTLRHEKLVRINPAMLNRFAL